MKFSFFRRKKNEPLKEESTKAPLSQGEQLFADIQSIEGLTSLIHHDSKDLKHFDILKESMEERNRDRPGIKIIQMIHESRDGQRQLYWSIGKGMSSSIVVGALANHFKGSDIYGLFSPEGISKHYYYPVDWTWENIQNYRQRSIIESPLEPYLSHPQETRDLVVYNTKNHEQGKIILAGGGYLAALMNSERVHLFFQGYVGDFQLPVSRFWLKQFKDLLEKQRSSYQWDIAYRVMEEEKWERI